MEIMYQITYTVDGITYKMETPYSTTTKKAISNKYGDRLTSIKATKIN